jgi:C_GCAxxG_C_C family probable redox protein
LKPNKTHILELVHGKAENLYLARRMLCAEAVLVTLNGAFGGGLTETQAVSLAAPFCVGIGGSGCVCGALSGGVLALGLFLGDNGSRRNRSRLRGGSAALHARFMETFGAVCCRELTKMIRKDRKRHFLQCAAMTADTAVMATEVLLAAAPKLLLQADREFLSKRDTKAGGLAKSLKLLQFSP